MLKEFIKWITSGITSSNPDPMPKATFWMYKIVPYREGEYWIYRKYIRGGDWDIIPREYHKTFKSAENRVRELLEKDVYFEKREQEKKIFQKNNPPVEYK